MLNFVAILFSLYLVWGAATPWRDPNLIGRPVGREVERLLELPRIGSTRLHWGFFVSLVVAVIVGVVLRYTRIGFGMRVLASSDKAAHYAGINTRRLIMQVLITSGAIAGLAGAIELIGQGGRFSPEGLAVGLGYTGIVVAALGRLSPPGIVVAAVLLGGVENATITLQSLSTRIPISVSTIIEGTLIIFVVGGATLLRYRWRWIRRQTSITQMSLDEPPAQSQAGTA